MGVLDDLLNAAENGLNKAEEAEKLLDALIAPVRASAKKTGVVVETTATAAIGADDVRSFFETASQAEAESLLKSLCFEYRKRWGVHSRF